VSRRPWLPVLALAGLLAVPARAAVPPAPQGIRYLSVPVEGGGTVALPYRGTPPRGARATRVPAPAGPRAAGGADTAPPPTDYGPKPADESRQFPADASGEPGTIASIAGGQCEGYPAREATIAPAHLAYDSRGRLYFVDVVTQGAGHHRDGSSLVRMVDTDGRVRTLGPVFGPDEGRSDRQVSPHTSLVSIVPDEHGGVYLNANFGDPITYSAAEDVPRANQLVHLRADGEREVVVGGLPSPGTPVTPAAGDGDPVTRTSLTEAQGWTFDRDGNVYVADAVADGFFGTRIRFANRSAKPVTFYPGTGSELTVQPGTIATIAGTGSDTVENGAGYVRTPSVPARTANFYEIPRLALHRVGDTDVLYFISTRWGGWQAPTGSEPALVHALNLFSRTPQVVNGQAVDPGYATVVAGNVAQPAGYGGDGGPAVAARFGFEVAQEVGDFYVARDGSLVLADTSNHRVRTVDPLGLVRTVAGTGVPGFNAEDADARLSNLWSPAGIVADPLGRTVFSDYANGRIRRIEADGRVVTVAGRGPTPCGDGHLATGPTVHSGAYFGHVSDTAYDSHGNLWVADAAFKTIRRIAPSGRIDMVVGQVQRCAGSLYSFVANVVVDSLSPCPFVGAQSSDGPLADLRLAGPQHLRVDSYDNLLVSDLDRLVYVNLHGRAVSVLGVTVPARAAVTLRTFGARTVHIEIPVPGGLIPPGLPDVPLPVDPARSIAWDATIPLGDLALDADGTVYLADPLLDVVYRLTTCDDVRVLAGTGHEPVYGGQGDGGPAAAASLVPHDLEIDRAGRLLYVVDAWANGRVATGSAPYGARVRAISLDDKRTHAAYGVDVAPRTVETVAGGARCSDAGFACGFGYGGRAVDAAVGAYATIARAGDGSLYVADLTTRRIGVVFPDGRYYGVAGPWPEKRDGEAWLGGDGPARPSGYLGDGGRALDAWFSWSWDGESSDAELTPDPRGGLLLTDAVGRVRRIAEVARTQLRTGTTVPPLPAAGAGWSEVALALGPVPAGTMRSAVSRPDLVETAAGPVLAAPAGTGRGCAVWRVRRDADGHGHDTATADGNGHTAAFPLGGSDCAAAAGPGSAAAVTLATGVRTRDGNAASDDVGLLAATSSGTTWAPAPVTATDRLGGLGLGGPALSPDATLLAYPTASGGLGVATPGPADWLATTTPLNAVHAVGDAVVANGVPYVGVVALGPRAAVVQVATSLGGTWHTETVATAGPKEMRHVGAPSLAADRAGTLYAAWSDQRDVYVAHRLGGGRWSAAVRLRALHASVLPTVTAGEPGRVAVGFWASARPRSDADDPYAFWYAATAVSTNATAARSSYDVRVASPSDELRGALCETCPPGDDVQDTQRGATGCAFGGPCPLPDLALGRAAPRGRVRVRLAPDGGLGLAFAVDAALTGDGLATGVGYLRSCRPSGLLAAAHPLPACTGVRTPPAVRRPPPGRPGDGLPPVPELPSPTGCSPHPPAYATPPAPRPPAPRPPDDERPDPRPAVPPLVVVGLLPPVPPPDLAPPEAQAPAANSQLNQVEQGNTNNATQAGNATGMAESEEEQERTADEYAFAALALGAAAMTAAASGYAYRRRPAPVRA
jgi:hypothetical protein